jgi:16S rRNA (uracil1498-N3)-methyltransferase
MPQIVRLFVDQPLAPGQPVALTADQAHYLFSVMRLAPGDALRVFNGRDGEWRAEVAEAGRRGGRLVATARTAPQRDPPDLWLLFAPLKKARTDFIVEKATELGAARILPVQTRLTGADRIARDRLQAHAVEAAEQCGGTFVPEVAPLQPLDRLLDAWPAGRRLLWCDERLAGRAVTPPTPIPSPRGGGEAPPSPLGATDRPAPPSPLVGEGWGGGAPGPGLARHPWAILIGPEGGFAEGEQARLRALPFVQPVSLGPRILRADTAAVAAITLWQATQGDWR